MWHLKVFSVIYFTAVCAAQDASDVTEVYGHANSPTPESPTHHDPPVLQSQSLILDVFPSEKVEFNCNISGSSDWTFIWYRNGHLIQDQDTSLSFSAEGSVLTVTAASEAHSGSYSCRGRQKTKDVTTAASNSLELKIYANKPQTTVVLTSKSDKVFPGESVTFQCKVNVSTGWDYLWYHNGIEIQGFTKDVYTIVSIDHPKSGQYYCKAKRGKGPFYTEQSETTTLQISDPPTPSLKLLSPWSDVFPKEIVEMRCEVDSSGWTFIWYKDGLQVQGNPEEMFLDEEEGYLNITSATETHGGVYTCKAQLKSRRVFSNSSNMAQVTVYGYIPKPILSKDPVLNPMYVGEKVSFTCKVDVSSGWQYEWYKDGNKLTKTEQTNEIHLGLSDGGKYYCKGFRGDMILIHHSEKMTQDVLEIPVPTLKLNTQWGDVFPTESVKLSCEMQSSLDWRYTWYRNDQVIEADDTASFESNGSTTTLFINSASDSHAGQYKCKGHLNGRSVSSTSSSGLTLTVYGMKPSVVLTQDPEYKVMFAGESVSFSCNINVSSGWEYLWHRDGTPLHGTLNNYLISSVGKTNSGSYTCRAKRGRNQVFQADSQGIHLEVKENKPKPSVTQQPNVEKLYTGESVSFICTLEISSGWEYSWYKDGVPLTDNSASFRIYNATSLDTGAYECMARRDKTKFNTEHSNQRILNISEIPVPLLKQSSLWLDVFPTESVNMICGMKEIRSDWTYRWYRDGQEIHRDNAVSIGPDGTTLSISSASASHRGQYSCSGKLKSRPVDSTFSHVVTLDVYDTKPSIILVQTPDYKLMHTGDSVSFRCHINVSSGWEYLWYKDDTPLSVSGNNYSITSVATTNAGSYTCQAKRGQERVFHTDKRSLRLEVEERPSAAIDLLTGWSEVFSTDSLILKCEVKESQYIWNYTWYKEGQEINLMYSEKYIVTPQNNPEQTLYTCRGIRSGRPSYSQTSHSFATKNLLLKRRVLLSISGCLFFGIIAVFIGCIVLRVIHKPEHDSDKPEEAELFLTMAQLKDRGDVPSPMVDYITDEALNAPSKEGDENGKICSESTPLPITSMEDQAVTAESLEAAENNGGMVSFKQ